jgi:hypothetical protein
MTTVEPICFFKIKILIFFFASNYFFMFSDRFEVKKNNFNIFLNKKHFEKKLLL